MHLYVYRVVEAVSVGDSGVQAALQGLDPVGRLGQRCAGLGSVSTRVRGPVLRTKASTWQCDERKANLEPKCAARRSAVLQAKQMS